MKRTLDRLRRYHPKSKDFIPFSVTFDMTSPVMLGHPYIAGEALIMRMLLRSILDEDFYNLPAKIPIQIDRYLTDLPLKTSSFSTIQGDLKIVHASVSQFDTDKAYLETMYKRFDSTHMEQCKTKRRKVPLNMGFYRNFMMKVPYVPSKTVKFYFNGGIEEIECLLNHVTHIGKKAAYGFGKVRSMKIEELNEDLSLVRNGVAMRPIPESIKDFGIPEHSMLLAYKSPFWDKRNIMLCAAPGSKYYGNAGSSA